MKKQLKFTLHKKQTQKKNDSASKVDWDKDILAFGVGELGLRLDDVHEMSYYEFQLKSYAYYRMQKEKMYHTRLIAYYGMIGSHLDPKKLPKNIDSFMSIENEMSKKSSNLDDETRELFLKRKAEYEAQLKKEEKDECKF